MGESLDAILKGSKTPAPAVVEPAPKAEPVEARAEAPTETAEAKAQRERDEQGRFKAKTEGQAAPKVEAPKVDAKPAPTAAEKQQTANATADAEQRPPAGHVPVKGLIEERRKRQEAERLLAEHLARTQQPQQQGHPQQQTPSGVDPLWDVALNTSEIAVRDKHGDAVVDEAQNWFLEAAEANPALYASLRQQRHPYKWVIQQFQQSRLLQEIGDDPDAYRDRLKSQWRAEWEAENAQKNPQRPAPVAPHPSLANASSAAGGISTAPVYDGPTPLTSIIRR